MLISKVFASLNFLENYIRFFFVALAGGMKTGNSIEEITDIARRNS